jgi:hypothetical protein
VWPDWAKFQHLGNIFWRWAHFCLKNIAQRIWVQFFSKILDLGGFFVSKFQYFDQKILWEKVLIY